MLTHPSNPPPSLFIPVLQFLPPSRFSSQACWHGRWAALKCPCLSIWSEMWLCVVWGGQRVFFYHPPRRTKCQGLPSVKVKSRFSLKVFWRLPSQLRCTSSKSCGNSWCKNCLCFCPICSLYICYKHRYLMLKICCAKVKESLVFIMLVKAGFL